MREHWDRQTGEVAIVTALMGPAVRKEINSCR
jgi:hypothetical protein